MPVIVLDVLSSQLKPDVIILPSESELKPSRSNCIVCSFTCESNAYKYIALLLEDGNRKIMILFPGINRKILMIV